MSPKSRPFDEVAKDVFSDEGNVLQPVTSDTADHMVAAGSQDARREYSLLRYLVGLHQDAAAFYKAAATSTRYPALESQLRDLWQLHEAQVDALGLRLRATSEQPDAYQESNSRETFVFGDIMHMLTTDIFPINVVDAAERKTAHAMEAAAQEEGVPADVQLLLTEQAGGMTRAFDILDEIKVLQER